MNKKLPATERLPAPDTEPAVVMSAPAIPVAPAPQPRLKTIERQGVRSEPYTRRYPQVRGGICEYCGVLDIHVPAEQQYKLCGHFRGLGELRCSYCDEAKDPTDVIGHAILNIAEHPDNPDSLVVWCNSYDCSRRHETRFKRSR